MGMTHALMGMMSGYGQRAREENLLTMNREIAARKNISDLYMKLAESPTVPAGLKQLLAEAGLGYAQTPHDKKPQKSWELGEIMRKWEQMQAQTPPPGLGLGGQSPGPTVPGGAAPPAPAFPGSTPPGGLPPGGQPGAEAIQPPPVPEQVPEFEPFSPQQQQGMFYSPEQMAAQKAQAELMSSQAKTAGDVNRYQQMQRAAQGSGIEADLLPPGLQPYYPPAPVTAPRGASIIPRGRRGELQPEGAVTTQGPFDLNQAIIAAAQGDPRAQEAVNAIRDFRSSTSPLMVLGTDAEGNPFRYFLTPGQAAAMGGMPAPLPQAMQERQEARAQAGRMLTQMRAMTLGGEWTDPTGLKVRYRGVTAQENPWWARVEGWGQQAASKMNLVPELQEYEALLRGFAPFFARSLGHRGNLTEVEILQTINLFPAPGDSAEVARRKLRNVNAYMTGSKPAPVQYKGDAGPSDGLTPPPEPPAAGPVVGDQVLYQGKPHVFLGLREDGSYRLRPVE